MALKLANRHRRLGGVSKSHSNLTYCLEKWASVCCLFVRRRFCGIKAGTKTRHQTTRMKGGREENQSLLMNSPFDSAPLTDNLVSIKGWRWKIKKKNYRDDVYAVTAVSVCTWLSRVFGSNKSLVAYLRSQPTNYLQWAITLPLHTQLLWRNIQLSALMVTNNTEFLLLISPGQFNYLTCDFWL